MRLRKCEAELCLRQRRRWTFRGVVCTAKQILEKRGSIADQICFKRYGDEFVGSIKVHSCFIHSAFDILEIHEA